MELKRNTRDAVRQADVATVQFRLARPQPPEFRRAFKQFYGGEPDPVMVGLLA